MWELLMVARRRAVLKVTAMIEKLKVMVMMIGKLKVMVTVKMQILKVTK